MIDLIPVGFKEISRTPDFITIELKCKDDNGNEYSARFKTRQFYEGSLGKALRRLIPERRPTT